jgi:hypothetical protein
MKKLAGNRTPNNMSIGHKVTSVSTAKIGSTKPGDRTEGTTRIRRISRKIVSNNGNSKSPVIIRGLSRDRATFGIEGMTESERLKIRVPVKNSKLNATPKRIYRGETTLNKTSSPLKPLTDFKVTSKRIIVKAPQDSESSPRYTIRKTTTSTTPNRTPTRRVIESKIVHR